MDDRRIRDIHFLEDSNDEVFITKLLLKSQKININIIHYPSYYELKKLAPATGNEIPILMFIDFNLPGIKGTEVIADILRRGVYDNLIIGICSGSEDPADKRNALEAGANFFVRKPLDGKALERVCEAVSRLTLQRSQEGVVSLYAC